MNKATTLVVRCTVDTRSFDDDGKVIPGSGDPVPCSHCGRSLVVHVHVVDCEPVKNSAGTLVGWRPVNEVKVIGTRCTKIVGAIERFRGVKWVST